MTPDPSLARRIDPIFADFAHHASPGCAVGVLRAGEPVFVAGYGQASVELGVPIAADTRFRIASVSKHFTVTGALLLADEGQLELDADVRALLPEMRGLPEAVTVEQLMRNTSGLPDFLELLRLGGVTLEARFDRSAMLQAIAACRHLNFTPGSRFLYCNSNFLLLGLLVERLGGCSLGDFLQRRVFGPLRMDATALVVGCDEPVPGLALPYIVDVQGRLRRALHGFEHGGEGGLVSNVPDLLVWARELLRPQQLPSDLLARLSSATRLSGGAPSPYARGLEHSRVAGLAAVGHGGLWPGYRTEWLSLPEADCSVVVISNCGASNPYRLARQVAEAVLARVPTPAAGAGIDASICGTWLDASLPALFDLQLKNGEAMVTQWGVPFVVQPQADGSWVALRGGYEFTLHKDGETLRVDVGAGDLARFERLTERPQPDAMLAGRYRCQDGAAVWDIEPPAAGAMEAVVRASGAHAAGAGPWRLRGVAADLVEVQAVGTWMTTSQLARVERDATGRIVALRVFSSRIRGLRFERE
jgi:D-aminopeptidase